MTRHNPTRSTAIFAIDGGDDMHARAKFLHHLDTLNAMHKLRRPAEAAIGRWKDPETGVIHLEDAYAMDLLDYHTHVLSHGWVNNQTCILIVTPLQAALAAPDGTRLEALAGMFREVGPAMPEGDWTYFRETGVYWQVLA